jgi:hypothetical protein
MYMKQLQQWLQHQWWQWQWQQQQQWQQWHGSTSVENQEASERKGWQMQTRGGGAVHSVVGSEAVDCVWCCLVVQFVIRSGFPVLSNHPVVVCCF